MRLALAVCLLALLAGCVAPAPFLSPASFDSPLPTPDPERLYLPLTLGRPALKGVTLACGGGDSMAREVEALNVSWIWNWNVDPPQFPGIESVPCIWDGRTIGKPLGGNSQWLLGFNEPDQWDQANTPPDVAAQQWAELEATYPGYKLASPQVVQWEKRWLEEFYDAYVAQNNRPPRLDALAIHTYWGKTRADYQEQVAYYINLAERWGVPEVWVTEFTLAPELDGTVRETVAELAAYIEWLETQPMVSRYAIWTNRTECMPYPPGSFYDTPLVGVNGQLTEVGKMYSAIRPGW